MDQANKNVQEQAQSTDAPDSRSVGGKDTSSENFRSECEARYVLAKPLSERRKYLDDVEKHRGKSGRSYLEAALQKEWDKRKAPKKGAN